MTGRSSEEMLWANVLTLYLKDVRYKHNKNKFKKTILDIRKSLETGDLNDIIRYANVDHDTFYKLLYEELTNEYRKATKNNASTKSTTCGRSCRVRVHATGGVQCCGL